MVGHFLNMIAHVLLEDISNFQWVFFIPLDTCKIYHLLFTLDVELCTCGNDGCYYGVLPFFSMLTLELSFLLYPTILEPWSFLYCDKIYVQAI